MVEIRHKEDVIQALKGFKHLMPYRGTVAERKEKFELLFNRFKTIYNMPELSLVFDLPDDVAQWTKSGASNYNVLNHRLTLKGKLSTLTFLHEFAHALPEVAASEEKAHEWSEELFKEVYPVLWSRLTREEGSNMMLAPEHRMPAAKHRS